MNIILVGVTFVLVVATVPSSALISGTLTVNGVTCQYSSFKATYMNNTGLGICNCKRNQKSIDKTCVYYPNNPHNSPAFNEDQRAYYQALATSAMNNGSPCDRASISEDIVGLVYPCYFWDCPGGIKGRRRRDVNAPTCPLVDAGDGSLNAASVGTPNSTTNAVNKSFISVSVGLLITLMLKSSL